MASPRVTTDPAEIDFGIVHRWLSEDAYWAIGRSRETLDQAAHGSLNFGVLDANDELIGYARAVTDHATFAWVCDIYVAPPHVVSVSGGSWQSPSWQLCNPWDSNAFFSQLLMPTVCMKRSDSRASRIQRSSCSSIRGSPPRQSRPEHRGGILTPRSGSRHLLGRRRASVRPHRDCAWRSRVAGRLLSPTTRGYAPPTP